MVRRLINPAVMHTKMISTQVRISLLAFLIVGIGVLAASFSDTDEKRLLASDLEKMKLKGEVSSLMITRYLVPRDDHSDMKDTLLSQEQIFFDKEGQVYERVAYENGVASVVSKYLFDSAGRQLLQRDYDLEGNLLMSVKYMLNEKGFRVKAIFDWPDYYEGDDDFGFEVSEEHPYSFIVYRNDYRGYCTEERYLRPDNSLYCRYENMYDFRGNKSEMNYFNSNNKHTWRKTYKYNVDNYVQLSRMYKDNRVVVMSDFSYEYDEEGNWTTRKEYRKLYYNIYTSLIDKGDVLTKRKISYYPY
jgi:hypothetical protein